MMGERYKILPNAAFDGIESGEWLIFDTVENQFLQPGFERKVQAEAQVADLMNVRREASRRLRGIGLGRDLTSGPVERLATVESDELINSGNGDNDADARELRGLQIVLDALVGKVVCSNCTKEYHGAEHQTVGGVTYPPSPTHSLKVTRYIGYDTPKLTVDLTCTSCDHTGLYAFPDNPLVEFLKEFDDIVSKLKSRRPF